MRQTHQIPDKPVISVTLPVCNGARFLEPAVNSILNQDFQNFELLICDDGSSDGTTGMVRDFEHSDTRIRAIYWQANRGIPTAHNVLIDQARGEYLACMDADDISLPDRLGRQLEDFPKEDESAVLTGACALIDENDNKLGLYAPPTKDFDFHMRFGNPFVHPLLFTRTSLIRRFKYRQTQYASDYDLFFRMMVAGVSFHITENPLLQYRIHENNLNNSKKAFVQMSTAMWIRQLIRTASDTSEIADLECLREQYSFKVFEKKWPAYAACIHQNRDSKWPWLPMLLNYFRFDPLVKESVRNSIQYTLARFIRYLV